VKVEAILRAAAYLALGQAWPSAKTAALYEVQGLHREWFVGTMVAGLGAGLAWNVRLAILKSIGRFVLVRRSLSETLVGRLCTFTMHCRFFSRLEVGSADQAGLFVVADVALLLDSLLLCAGDKKIASVKES
jgi:hypothetical protein